MTPTWTTGFLFIVAAEPLTGMNDDQRGTREIAIRALGVRDFAPSGPLGKPSFASRRFSNRKPPPRP
jgi:hypothetical protein